MMPFSTPMSIISPILSIPSPNIRDIPASLNGGATLFFTTFTFILFPIIFDPCFIDSIFLTSIYRRIKF